MKKPTKMDEKLSAIMSVVCDNFKVTAEDLRNGRHFREIATPRQVYSYFARKHTKISNRLIAKSLNQVEPSTVIHSCRTVENLMWQDKWFKHQVEETDKTVREVMDLFKYEKVPQL